MTSVEPLDFTKQSVTQVSTPASDISSTEYAKVSVDTSLGRKPPASALSRLLGQSQPGSKAASVSPNTSIHDTLPESTASNTSDRSNDSSDSGGRTTSNMRAAAVPVSFSLGGSSSQLRSAVSRGSSTGGRSRSSSLLHTPPGPGNGFVFGAGEVGNVSSPRYSTSVQNRERINSTSVEARFIVNIPRTPSNREMQSSSSFLGRSFSRLSLSNRAGSLSKTPTSSSVLSIKRFIEKPWKNSPPDSPASSFDSSSIRMESPANSVASNMLGQGFPVRGSTTGIVDEITRRGSLSKSYGRLGKTLGEGAGGHVKIVKSQKDGKIFAVKEFRAKHSSETAREYQKKVGGEYCLGMTLKHPNIVETLDIVYEPDRVFQIMEYIEYDLFAIVMSGKMSLDEVYCDFRQLMSGVKYLHDSGIAHRDLKLDNCVVSAEGIVKIIDFGSSVIFRYPESDKIYDSHGVVGSDPYLAPEAATGDRYDPRATDIWSSAVVLCCMIMRKFPWKAPRLSDSSFKTFLSKENGVHVGMEKLLVNLPPETHSIFRGMFDLDPVTRWSVTECWDDEWLSGTNYCTKSDGEMLLQDDHTHSTVPFEEAHIAMLEKKNRKAKKSEKMW